MSAYALAWHTEKVAQFNTNTRKGIATLLSEFIGGGTGMIRDEDVAYR